MLSYLTWLPQKVAAIGIQPKKTSIYFTINENPINQNLNHLNLHQGWDFINSQTEAVVQRCSLKKVFSEILQNSQGNICTRISFLIKLQALGLWQRLWHRCFPVSFAKCLRTLFFIEHLWWLLLVRFWFKQAALLFAAIFDKSLILYNLFQHQIMLPYLSHGIRTIAPPRKIAPG